MGYNPRHIDHAYKATTTIAATDIDIYRTSDVSIVKIIIPKISMQQSDWSSGGVINALETDTPVNSLAAVSSSRHVSPG